MRKIPVFILALTMIFGMVQGAAAAQNEQGGTTVGIYLGPIPIASTPVNVHINDTEIDFDVKPIIYNGRTLVPMRKVFESLGSVVTWDEPTKSVTAKKDETVVNLTVDSYTMFVNGNPVALDIAPLFKDSRVLVPVRAIAEAFDYKVEWIPATQSVKIYTDSDFSFKKPQLTSVEIADKVSPSVFYIEVYDAAGYFWASGSGFFIDSDGIAVTNHHVIEGSSSAYITTTSGGVFKVERIIGYNTKLDIAVIKISKENLYGSPVYGFPPLSLANSDNIKAGQVVYALGSPQGFQNSISSGIISNVRQVVDENTYIQVTAPISHGSSGGALINEYGEVLGITTAIANDAQNIGFCVPINNLDTFDLSSQGVTYKEFAENDLSFRLVSDIFIVSPNKQKDYTIVFEKPYVGKLYVKSSNEDVLTCEICAVSEDKLRYTLRVTAKNQGKATITVYSDLDTYGKSFSVAVDDVADIL